MFWEKMKSQAAMEYLLTHAWSFLIIGVVLVVLFNLGIFSSFYAPRAPPGSCSVVRPLGVGSITGVSLQGDCAGTLPQYVTKFGATGSNANVLVTNTLRIYPANTGITISFWFELSAPATSQEAIVTTYAGASGSPCGYKIGFQASNQIYISDSCTSTSNTILASYPFAFTATTWYNVVAIVGPTSPVGGTGSIPANIYVDDINYVTGSASHWAQPNTWTTLTIGSGYGSGGTHFPNYLANLQIYNTSLNSGDVKELYIDGIGGAPINLRNIVGWWPLNGNVTDYSGNNNNAQSMQLAYQSGWSGGYTLP